jgi:uncharacterized protein (DUF736 family)
MAIIGIFQATENGYEGTLETLTLKAKISIESANKNNDKAPDYRVFQVTDHFKSEIGAAWKKSSREGTQYLSLNIDDLSLATKAYCRLVRRERRRATRSSGNVRAPATGKSKPHGPVFGSAHLHLFRSPDRKTS